MKYVLNFLVVISTLLLTAGCASTAPEISAQDLVRVGNYQALVQRYKVQLARSPGDSAIMLKLADAYYQGGDTESAQFYIEQLRRTGRQSASLYFLSGKVYSALGEYDLAMDDYRQAQALGLRDPGLELNLGIVHGHRQEFAQARQAFNRARLQGYDDVSVKNNLAVVAIAEKDYRRAIEILLPVYRQQPNHEQVKTNLAIALFKLGDLVMASRVLGEGYSEQQVTALFNSLYDRGAA